MLDLLTEETSVLRGFLVLLEREQSLLAAGDVDSLTPLAADKSAAADRLADLSRRRDGILTAAGCGNMDDWLARPGNAGAIKAWRSLLELAKKAKQLNEINGGLIGLRLAHNQQALAVLMAAADQAMTYGPDGQQRPVGGGRSFGSA